MKLLNKLAEQCQAHGGKTMNKVVYVFSWVVLNLFIYFLRETSKLESGGTLDRVQIGGKGS